MQTFGSSIVQQIKRPIFEQIGSLVARGAEELLHPNVADDGFLLDHMISVA